MGASKKARGAAKKAKGGSGAARDGPFDMFSAFNQGVEQMQAGGVKEAAAIFARCFVQAQKVVDNRPEDADSDKVAAIEEVMFECLVYRAACLQATCTQPAVVEAVANLEKAVLLAKEPDKLCQALDLLATAEGKCYKHDRRLFTADKLLECTSAPEQASLQAAALVHRGAALVALGRHGEALAPLQEAREQAADSGAPRTEADACALLAHAHLHTAGGLTQARAAAEAGVAAAEAPGTPPGVLSCALQALGTVCLEASEPAVAAECFSRAMQAGGGGGREQPDTGAGGSGRLSLGDGRCLLARVAAFVQLGNTAPAESQLEAAIALAEATADQVLGGEALLAAACLHYARREAEEAAGCLQQAAALGASSSVGSLELAGLVGLSNLAASGGPGADDAAELLAAVAAKESELFPAAPPTVEDGKEAPLVMPCCRTRVVPPMHGSDCPGCGRHVCGRRYPGLPACATCPAAVRSGNAAGV